MGLGPLMPFHHSSDQIRFIPSILFCCKSSSFTVLTRYYCNRVWPHDFYEGTWS